MVSFRCFQEGTLTIIEKEGDTLEKGTTFDAHSPLIGRFAASVPHLGYSLHLSHWSKELSCELSPFGPFETSKDTSFQQALLLQSALHEQMGTSNKFLLLGNKVRNGYAGWNFSPKMLCDLAYTEKYWEWTKDILSRNGNSLKVARLYDAIFASLFSYDRHPNVLKAFFESWSHGTNTLHTSVGEVSISLWDLHEIGGLPFSGKFYDEVIPNAKELSGKTKDGKFFLPICCQHLFLAYHRLAQDFKGVVKISDWVNFWYKGSLEYPKPPIRKSRNKTQRPRELHNPSGSIGPVRKRTLSEEKMFVDLGVSDEVKERTYLAAFLACWLCKFVLPSSPANIVRPGVFKIASRMAHGEVFCLTVPVLASIYRGLNEIVSLPESPDSTVIFPAHYVYVWLAEYFQTHFRSPINHSSPRMTKYAGEGMAKHFDTSEAQDLFKSCKGLVLNRLAMKFHQRAVKVDDEMPIIDFEYLASLRSSFLSLRQGAYYVLEPYSPHRFSRQFGFHQDIPGSLKQDISTGSLDEVFKYWQSCTLYNTKSSVLLPETASLKEFSVTKSYVDWWSKVHVDPFMTVTEILLRHKRPASPKNKETKSRKGETPNQRPGSHTKHMTGEPSKTQSRDNFANESTSPFNPSSHPSNIQQHPRSMVIRIGGGKTSSERNWKHMTKVSDCASSAENVISLPDTEDFFDGLSSGSLPMQVEDLQVEDDNGAIDGVNHLGVEESVYGPSAFELATRKGGISPSLAGVKHSFQGSDQALVDPRPHDSSAGDRTQGQARVETVGGDVTPQVPIQESHQAPFSEAPTYNVKRMAFGIRRQSALALGNNLKRMLKRTEFSKAPLLRSSVEETFDEISSLPVDCSQFQERVNSYLQSAEEYNDIKSRYAQALTEEVHSQRLADIESHLNEVLSSDSVDVAHVQKHEADLLNDKKELEILLTQIEKRETSILEANLRISQRKDVIANLNKERNAIEEIPIIPDHDHGVVSTLEKLLKKEQDEILELDWLP